MVLDLFAQCNKPKTSKTIQCFEQWVMCFNTYTAVMTTWLPNRMNDLLGYASLIIKASKTPWWYPWLHFRKLAAANWLRVGCKWRCPCGFCTLVMQNFKLELNQHLERKGDLDSKTTQGKGVDKLPSRRESSGRQQSKCYLPYPWRPPICQRWNQRGWLDATLAWLLRVPIKGPSCTELPHQCWHTKSEGSHPPRIYHLLQKSGPVQAYLGEEYVANV